MRYIITRLSLLAVLLSLSTLSFALEFEVEGIKYKVTYSSDLAVSVISKSSQYSREVVIPETVSYNGKTYSVTSIGSSAFIRCSSLTSVTIPNSVTEIGSSAFNGCSSLTSVTIPNSVTKIGYSAFTGCRSLTSVTIPNSVTSIDDYVFYECINLTSVTIGNSVKSIGYSAFYGCSSLTSVTIPNSVTEIGFSAFNGCSSLTSFTFPDSITSINLGIFKGCSSLTSITIGSGVTHIKVGSLSNLNNIYIKLLAQTPPGLEYEDRDAFRKIEVPKGSACKYALDEYWQNTDTIFVLDGKTCLYPIPINWKGSKVVAINGSDEGYEAKEGEDVTIKAYSLANKPLVMKSTQNVSNILSKKGSFTFKPSCCHSDNVIYTYDFPLTNITLSESGTLIDKVNIDKVLDIENLKISGNINGTDLLVIRKMENLKLLDLGDAHIVEGGMSYYKNYVTSKNRIGNYFFSNNKNIYTVILPQDITEICDYAFFNVYELKTILIPKSVKILSRCFSNTNLHSIHIEDLEAYFSIKFNSVWDYHNPYWYEDKHYIYLNDERITDLVIPNSVSTVNSSTFENLFEINTLVIHSAVTKIGEDAFNCQIKKSITCLNPIPPEISRNTFGWTSAPFNVPPNYMTNYERVTLYVPKGSKNLYWLHPYWENFKNIVELDATSVKDITVDNPTINDGVYTLEGVKVSSNADNMDNIPKGTYIINGKKVIKK